MKKKVFSFIAVLCIGALCLGGCSHAEYFVDYLTDEVIASLGKYSDKEYYTDGGFQDYTDYAKYKYEEPRLEDNPYLKLITEETFAEFMEYLEDFEYWVADCGEGDPDNELFKCYDFSTYLITDDDYVYIDDRSTNDDLYDKFDNYNLYFFDIGTSTLYYFHSNI